MRKEIVVRALHWNSWEERGSGSKGMREPWLPSVSDRMAKGRRARPAGYDAKRPTGSGRPTLLIVGGSRA